MKKQIEQYLRQLAPHQNDREGPQLLRGALKEIDALQAKIDNLMLEYCPDDMTEGQIENWGKHQKPVPNVQINRQAERRRETMSTEKLNNEARIDLSLLNAELDRLQAKADNAYSRFIGLYKKDECLGWEIKAERGQFGFAELQAHKDAAEELGRYRALQEMVNELQKLAGSNVKLTSGAAAESENRNDK